MFLPMYEGQFKKELEKAKKRGKDIEKIKVIMMMLLAGKQLPIKNRNHRLQGNFQGYWECHIEPDWLLVYKKTTTHIVFARTGTHSDLF